MNKYKKNIITYLSTLGLLVLVAYLWIILQAILHKSNPEVGNYIILLPLMLSIYFNIKNWLSD